MIFGWFVFWKWVLQNIVVSIGVEMSLNVHHFVIILNVVAHICDSKTPPPFPKLGQTFSWGWIYSIVCVWRHVSIEVNWARAGGVIWPVTRWQFINSCCVRVLPVTCSLLLFTFCACYFISFLFNSTVSEWSLLNMSELPMRPSVDCPAIVCSCTEALMMRSGADWTSDMYSYKPKSQYFSTDVLM